MMTTTDQSNLETLLKAEMLPQLPGSALRVMKLAQDLESPSHRLVEAIGSDPILTARILRAVNSPMYALARHVTSLPTAVNSLGSRAIQDLVMSYAAADTFNRSSGDSLAERALWRHSVAVGVAAREICKTIRRRGDAEKAFLYGLLHDIGTLGMLRHSPKFASSLRSASDIDERLDFERSIFGATHEQVGALIANRWGLGNELAGVLAFHHHPRQAKQNYVLTLVINAADMLASANGMGLCETHSAEISECEPIIALGLTKDNLDQIWKDTENTMDEMVQLLTAVL
jgi:putative nucleotidyltransferase with HDIG domain